MTAGSIRLGDEPSAHVRIEVEGFAHPEVAEPQGLDLLACRVHAAAPPVAAAFPLAIRVEELVELREYLATINSGNGPAESFAFAGGLFSLAFAPSRRGPILCAVQLKSIDAAHLRLEFLVTLEPESISRVLRELHAIA
ncbi:MAG: hypothetical protein KGN02_02140 [bacterium]|nr:hypothetical protein [bacterium]